MLLPVRHSFLVATLLTLFFILAGPAWAGEKWGLCQTAHFTIVSGGTAEETRRLALNLEQFRYAYSVLGEQTPSAPLPVVVMAFANAKTLTPFKPVYRGRPANVDGFFLRALDENILALRLNAREEVLTQIGYHEYVHVLTQDHAAEWPVWLQEGLANTYATFSAKRDTLTVGELDETQIRYLRYYNRLMSLERLFQITHQSPEYNEKTKQNLFYAQATLLTHYLKFGPDKRRQTQFEGFLRNLKKRQNPFDAFADAFGDVEDVERELFAYVHSPMYSVTKIRCDPAAGMDRQQAFRWLSEAESRFYLGDLALRTEHLRAARNYFCESARLDPESPRPDEGLGFLAMRHEDNLEAMLHFQKAIDHKTPNFLVYYLSASLDFDRLPETPPGTSGLVNDWSRIEGKLLESIRLFPAHAASHHLLGRGLMRAHDAVSAERAFQAALQREPENTAFLLSCARCQMAQNKTEAAEKTLERILRGQDSVERRYAVSLLGTLKSN